MKLPYIKAYKDRHGRARYYFRRKGFRSTQLPPPSSPGFILAYEAANSAKKQTFDASKISFLQQEIQAVIERCAQWHDKQEQMMVEAGDLIAAEWHRDSAAAIRALKQSDKPNFSVSRASSPTTTDR